MYIKRHLRVIILCSIALTCCSFHATPRSCAVYPISRRYRGGSSNFLFSDSVRSTPDEIVGDKATGTSQDTSNPIKSFMANFMPQNESDEQIETEEEKLRRLKLERLAEIEAGEVRRQQRVSEDKLGYLFLFLLQFLPLIGSDRVISIAYFFGLAVTTVYLGGRQEVIDAPEKISQKSAIYAPVLASVSIGVLYFLLKVGIDPTALYAIAVTVFGALALSDIGVPILRNIFPGIDFANAEVQLLSVS